MNYVNEYNSNAAVLTVNASLEITKQPQNAIADAGKTVQFNITAAGSSLTYQWQYKEKGSSTWTKCGLSGAKTASLQVPAVSGRNGNCYRCIVTDGSKNTVTSNAAVLTVKENLAITKHPQNMIAEAGKTVQFYVTAVGNSLTYQWQYRPAGESTWNKCGLAGAKTDSVDVPATESRNGTSYRCLVTDETGKTLVSNAATLTLKAKLAITKQPSSVSAQMGSTVYFSVTATGMGLTYQWQYQESGKSEWNKCGLEGAKTEKVTVPATAERNGYSYRCVLTDAEGAMLTSNKATLTASSANSAKSLVIPDTAKDIWDAVSGIVDDTVKDLKDGQNGKDRKETEKEGSREGSEKEDEAEDTAESTENPSFGKNEEAAKEDPASEGREESGSVNDDTKSGSLNEAEKDSDQNLTDTVPEDEDQKDSVPVDAPVPADDPDTVFVPAETGDKDDDHAETVEDAETETERKTSVEDDLQDDENGEAEQDDQALTDNHESADVPETVDEGSIAEETDLTDIREGANADEEVFEPISILVQPESVEVDEGQQAILYVEAEGQGLSYQWQVRFKDQEEWMEITHELLNNLGLTTEETQENEFIVRSEAVLNYLVFRCVVNDQYSQAGISDETYITVHLKGGEDIIDDM